MPVLRSGHSADRQTDSHRGVEHAHYRQILNVLESQEPERPWQIVKKEAKAEAVCPSSRSSPSLKVFASTIKSFWKQ